MQKHFLGEMNNIKKEIDFELVLPGLSVMDALDGFLFVISQEGQCLFVSPNVAQYLGITQVITPCFHSHFIFLCVFIFVMLPSVLNTCKLP